MATGAEQLPGRRRARAPKFALALPAWVWYALFFTVPVALIVRASFGHKIPGSAGRVSYADPGWHNYGDAFSATFFKVLKQGMLTSIIGTLLCAVIGFPIAYFLAVKVSARWKGVLLALLIVPFFTNFLIRTLGWRIALAPKGLISNFLVDHGLRDTPLQVLDTRFAVQLGVVYNYLPLMIFPLYVALERLDPALREASKDLGAGRIGTFLQVTLPLAAPGIVAGLVLVFVPLSGDYVTAAILGGAKGNMPGALVASQFLDAQNPALGAAIAVVLIGAILAILAVCAVIAKLALALIRSTRTVELAPA